METEEETNIKLVEDGDEVDIEVDNDDTDKESSSEEPNQPRVPLHIDPEFVDPNQHKYKYGVVYLSYVPDGLNVKLLRDIMEEFGPVGRIYLEPDEEQTSKTNTKTNDKKKQHRSYIEGWVEFKKKRDAKSVALTLNGTPLQYGKRHCKYNGQVWSIKYLHRFKWAHLTEQLAHDKAVRDQRRKFEMSQAKKQSDFFQKMMERSRIMKKHNHKPSDENKGFDFKPNQNKPKDRGQELKVSVDEELLTSIFKKVA